LVPAGGIEGNPSPYFGIQEIGQNGTSASQSIAYPRQIEGDENIDVVHVQTPPAHEQANPEHAQNPKTAQVLPKTSPSDLDKISQEVSNQFEDLSTLIRLWPSLSTSTRAGIMAMVKAMAE